MKHFSKNQKENKRRGVFMLLVGFIFFLCLFFPVQTTFQSVQAGPEMTPTTQTVTQRPALPDRTSTLPPQIKTLNTEDRSGSGSVSADKIQSIEKSTVIAPSIGLADNSAESPRTIQGVTTIRMSRTENAPNESGVIQLGSGQLDVQIPDQDYYWITMWTNESLPAGAEVTDFQYRVRIDDFHGTSGEDTTFWCGDYEIYLSSEAHGAPNKYLLVYDNLGGRTDGGNDDDSDDDSDIYLDMRSTSAFNGEDPTQEFSMWIEDTYSGDYGMVNYVEFDVYWEAPMPDLIAVSSAVSVETVREGENFWVRNGYRNDGNASAGPSHTKIYLSPGDDFDQSDDVLINPKKSLRALASGEEAEIQWDFVFPDMNSGNASYQVWIMLEVDCDDEVEESDENNLYKRNGAITVYQGTSDPDIEVNPLELVIDQPEAFTTVPPPDETHATGHALGLVIPEEVKAYWRTRQPKLEYEVQGFAAAIDWSVDDSPVKNQGSCGSCWAFSAVGLIENLSVENDLAEQVLVSCISGNDCGGGWHGYALEYIHDEGVPDEGCYPYLAQNGNCADKCADPEVLAKIQNYDKYGQWGEPTSNTVNDLKALLQDGPVLVTMDVPDDGTFDNYQGGIYNYSGGAIPAGRGHSVLLVGYDDVQQYFKAKNSWGSNWGEGGYFRIAFDDVTDDVNFGGYPCTGSGVTIERKSTDVFTISNVGDGTLEVTSITADKSWLSFDPMVPPTLSLAGGDARSIQCIVEWDAVPSPSDVSQVTIQSNDPDENPVIVTVRVNKGTTPTPVLVVNPGTLSFTANEGENPANQTLSISNAGSGSMSWSVTDDQTWLSVAPSNGTTTTEVDPVTVQVNSSAMTAGNYSGTITVTASGASDSPQTIPVSLSIQSGPGPCEPPFLQAVDMTGMAGSEVTLEINLDGNPTPIDAFGFKLSFCADKLSFVSAEKGDLISGFSFFQANEESPGVIRIGGFNTTGVPVESSGNFIRIHFSIQPCEVGETCNLILHDLVDDLVGINACNGIFTCGQNCDLGDVNLDGSITAGDALCAFQIYMNGGTPPEECDNECALIASDANCDGSVTSGDALVIFMAYMQGLEPPLECPSNMAKTQSPEIRLQINPIFAEPGAEITVPVYFQSSQAIRSFSLDLGYPKDLLEFVAVTPGELTQKLTALDGKVNLDGVITLGGYHTEPLAAPQREVLLYVQFKLKNEAAGTGDLWIFNPADDLAPAQIENSMLAVSSSSVEMLASSEVPKIYRLEQNFPNPFNLETEIAYQIPKAGMVKLNIYNSLGQRIRSLVQENHPAGKYVAHWDGYNDQGHEVPSGVYFYQIFVNQFTAVKKLLLIK